MQWQHFYNKWKNCHCNWKILNENDESKTINISIIGNIEELDIDYSSKINIEGDVGSVRTSNGNVEVRGNVLKDVKTSSGDVECCDVNGSIETTSGDVRCGKVTGSVKTISGDIKNK